MAQSIAICLPAKMAFQIICSKPNYSILMEKFYVPKNGFALHSFIALAAQGTVLYWTKPQPTNVPFGFLNNLTSSISPYFKNQF